MTFIATLIWLERYLCASSAIHWAINRYIKEISQAAGLTELVEIETEKYKLVHSHTARRTGATLMYLAGIDVYDIMKVTGHSSPNMLKKYTD